VHIKYYVTFFKYISSQNVYMFVLSLDVLEGNFHMQRKLVVHFVRRLRYIILWL